MKIILYDWQCFNNKCIIGGIGSHIFRILKEQEFHFSHEENHSYLKGWAWENRNKDQGNDSLIITTILDLIQTQLFLIQTESSYHHHYHLRRRQEITFQNGFKAKSPLGNLIFWNQWCKLNEEIGKTLKNKQWQWLSSYCKASNFICHILGGNMLQKEKLSKKKKNPLWPTCYASLFF